MEYKKYKSEYQIRKENEEKEKESRKIKSWLEVLDVFLLWPLHYNKSVDKIIDLDCSRNERVMMLFAMHITPILIFALARIVFFLIKGYAIVDAIKAL